MGLGKVVGLVVVVLLLLPVVSSANMVMTAERTALDAEYVSDTFEDEDVYEEIAETLTDEIKGEFGSVDVSEFEQVPAGVTVEQFNTSQIVEEAVSEDYVEEQSRSAIQSVYDYLHGRTDDLELTIDTRPLKEDIAAEIGEQAASVDAQELIAEAAAGLGNTRVPIDASTASSMLESESDYQRVKSDFRERVREEVRQETGASGEELDRQVEEALDRMASRTKSQIESTTREELGNTSENITGPVIDMQHAMVDGLTTDMGYQQFTSRIDRNERRLGDAIGQLAIERMNAEVDDEESLSQFTNNNLEDQLQGASSAVQQADTASLVLPILALLLIGGAYALTRTFQTTAYVTGGVLLGAAIGGFLLATLLDTYITTFIGDQIPEGRDAIADGVFALVDGILGTLSAQSLAIGAAGVVLLALAFADSKGCLADVRARASALGSGGGAGADPIQRPDEGSGQQSDGRGDTQTDRQE